MGRLSISQSLRSYLAFSSTLPQLIVNSQNAITYNLSIEPQSIDLDYGILTSNQPELTLTLAPDSALATLSSPATLLHLQPDGEINAYYLEKTVQDFLSSDDVFNRDFLAGLVFLSTSKSHPHFTTDATAKMRAWGTGWTQTQTLLSSQRLVPQGPYYLKHGALYRVSRVYDDDKLSFLSSIQSPTKTDRAFTEINTTGSHYRSVTIAVPSRLYYPDDPGLPLNGIRVAVKDNYHLAGLRTSLCNRDYYNLHPPQNHTAAVITRLVDKGAQIVGKTYMSSFATMEHPMQSIDYQASFNPRADGFQIPGGSSGGSASAVAAYPWLDFALGTDTSGSIRIPCLQNGCFALRPSSGLVSKDGIVPLAPSFDTPAFLGRDLSLFPSFMNYFYDEPPYIGQVRPVEIVLPTDYLEDIGQEQKGILVGLANDFASSLNATLVFKSISDTWEHTAPDQGKVFDHYFHNASLFTFYYEAYRQFEPARVAFKERNGIPLYTTEVNKLIWKLGSTVTDDQHTDMLARMSIFKSWFLNTYLNPNATSLVVLPIASVMPNYRDVYPGLPTLPSPGIPNVYLSAILGAPELAIPAGHVRFWSRISESNEILPVVAGVMGTPGLDLQLVTMALSALRTSGRPLRVKPGKQMWDER